MHESHASCKGMAHLPIHTPGQICVRGAPGAKELLRLQCFTIVGGVSCCGTFVVGYVDRYCAVLCASRGGDGDGGAKDLEAEAGKLDAVETRWAIVWAWRLERHP